LVGIQEPCSQVLHKVADTPLICHTVGTVLEGGWGPIVVVVSPQNGEAIKEVSPTLKPS